MAREPPQIPLEAATAGAPEVAGEGARHGKPGEVGGEPSSAGRRGGGKKGAVEPAVGLAEGALGGRGDRRQARLHGGEERVQRDLHVVKRALEALRFVRRHVVGHEHSGHGDAGLDGGEALRDDPSRARAGYGDGGGAIGRELHRGQGVPERLAHDPTHATGAERLEGEIQLHCLSLALVTERASSRTGLMDLGCGDEPELHGRSSDTTRSRPYSSGAASVAAGDTFRRTRERPSSPALTLAPHRRLCLPAGDDFAIQRADERVFEESGRRPSGRPPSGRRPGGRCPGGRRLCEHDAALQPRHPACHQPRGHAAHGDGRARALLSAG